MIKLHYQINFGIDRKPFEIYLDGFREDGVGDDFRHCFVCFVDDDVKSFADTFEAIARQLHASIEKTEIN